MEQEEIYFIGNGAEKFKNICPHGNARFRTDVFPSAKEMVKIAQEKLGRNDVEDVAYFEPYYLKDFKVG